MFNCLTMHRFVPAWVAYEYVITFGLEVGTLKKRKSTLSSLFLIITRYMALLSSLVHALSVFSQVSKQRSAPESYSPHSRCFRNRGSCLFFAIAKVAMFKSTMSRCRLYQALSAVIEWILLIQMAGTCVTEVWSTLNICWSVLWRIFRLACVRFMQPGPTCMRTDIRVGRLSSSHYLHCEKLLIN